MANIDSGKGFGEGVSRSDCAPFYAEIHLISLLNRLKVVVSSGQVSGDLVHIINTHKHEHPGFSAVIESFIAEAVKCHKDAVRIDNEREMFQRFYTAEQMKTQALIECFDV